MLRSLIFIVMLCATGAASSHIVNIDAMRDAVKRNSYVDLFLFDTDTTINIANTTSVDKIYIKLKSSVDIKTKKNLFVKCTSQCGIEFVESSNAPRLDKLSLFNAHLLANTKIHVENFDIKASEAIVTGLPLAKNVVITLEPSESMLAAQRLIKGVNVIPASGEFVYDTKIIYTKDGKPINSDNDQFIANAEYNLKSMDRTLKNLSWVSPVIAWFAVTKDNQYNLDISRIDIMPLVENRNRETSEKWQVGPYTRSTAHLSSSDENNRANYGGTVNDLSIVRYVDALSHKQKKVMFYPMIFLDMPGKPWRGFIKGSNAEDIHQFFNKEKGYNAFIIHYAKLLKDKINAFVIGSELEDLLQTVDDKYPEGDLRRYPAVGEMINLAKDVRKILGPEVVITYAANWSEYHHDKKGFRHLDPLWSSEYIDVVGIDAYLPIVKEGMGDITLDDIKKGWESGELWDFYYNKNAKERLSPEDGLKRIEYWWSNEHWSNGIKTSWKPKMKPIWFTEFGFPSMNRSINAPHLTYDPKNRSSKAFRHTSTNPDFALQARAIHATLEYWNQKSDIIQNAFLWAWDVRPFPYFPERLDLWSDGNQWSRGHWINGKIDLISQVKLLPDVDVCNIKANVDTIFVNGSFNSIGEIKASHVVYSNKWSEYLSKIFSLGCRL